MQTSLVKTNHPTSLSEFRAVGPIVALPWICCHSLWMALVWWPLRALMDPNLWEAAVAISAGLWLLGAGSWVYGQIVTVAQGASPEGRNLTRA